jgi:hypothetical protein
MKTRIEDRSEDQSTERSPGFVIETGEDCQLATDRIKALESSNRDEAAQDELAALEAALAAWHKKKATAGSKG